MVLRSRERVGTSGTERVRCGATCVRRRQSAETRSHVRCLWRVGSLWACLLLRQCKVQGRAVMTCATRSTCTDHTVPTVPNVEEQSLSAEVVGYCRSHPSTHVPTTVHWQRHCRARNTVLLQQDGKVVRSAVRLRRCALAFGFEFVCHSTYQTTVQCDSALGFGLRSIRNH